MAGYLLATLALGRTLPSSRDFMYVYTLHFMSSLQIKVRYNGMRDRINAKEIWYMKLAERTLHKYYICRSLKDFRKGFEALMTNFGLQSNPAVYQ